MVILRGRGTRAAQNVCILRGSGARVASPLPERSGQMHGGKGAFRERYTERSRNAHGTLHGTLRFCPRNVGGSNFAETAGFQALMNWKLVVLYGRARQNEARLRFMG